MHKTYHAKLCCQNVEKQNKKHSENSIAEINESYFLKLFI